MSLLSSSARPSDGVRQKRRGSAEQFFVPGNKAGFVRDVFDRIAGRYDLLNSVTSFGMHRRWRSRAIALTHLPSGGTALDIACGTGDFLPGLRRRAGSEGRVIGLDFSAAMLGVAKEKLGRRSVEAVLVRGDAEKLPFESESMNAVTIGFALRNLTDIEQAFREMHRVLAVGGRVVALEIARPNWWPYRPLFLLYFERLLPRLAAWFGGEELAYRWLPASLAAFCSRRGVVTHMERAGFSNVRTEDLAAGAVCIYIGEKE